MAFTAEQNNAIKDYVIANLDNPGKIAEAAAAYGITAQDLSAATGVSVNEVNAYFNQAGVSVAQQEAAPPAAPAKTTGSDYNVQSVLASNEPQAYKDLYVALQSGKARIGTVDVQVGAYDSGGVTETQYVVLDANGKQIPGVVVDSNTGQITLPSGGGIIRVDTNINPDGTFAPITNYGGQVTYTGGQSFMGGLRESVKELATSPATQIVLSAFIPGAGEFLAAELGVSKVVGTALASAAVQVSQGVPLEKAIQNAAINAGVQAGSADVMTEVVKAGVDPKIANALVSAGGSIAKTALQGGSSADIQKAVEAALAGSGTYSLTGSEALGRAVGGGVQGGVMGAATSLAGHAGGSKSTQPISTLSEAETQELLKNVNLASSLVPAIAIPPALQALSAAVPEVAAMMLGTLTAAGVIDMYNKLDQAGVVDQFKDALGQYLGTTAPQTMQQTLDAAKAAAARSSFAANDPRIVSSATSLLSDPATNQNKVNLTALESLTSTGYTPPEAYDISAPEGTKQSIVVAVNNDGSKALILDDTGAVSLVNVPAGTKVTVNQPVFVNPATGSIAISPTTPGTRNPPIPGAVPGALNPSIPGVVPGTLAPAIPAVTAGTLTPAIPKVPTPPITAKPPTLPPSLQPKPQFPDTEKPTPPSPPTPKEPYTPIEQVDKPEVTVTPPEITTPADTTPKTPGEEPKKPEDKKDPLFIYTYLSKPLRSPVVSAGAEKGPVSTVGLTGYRPAGEIESEETGKQRQDVWNEASLRLKDALGL